METIFIAITQKATDDNRSEHQVTYLDKDKNKGVKKCNKRD